MNIRTKLIAVVAVVLVVLGLSSCYSGTPVAQVPQTNIPKPSKQQGYLPAPTPVPVSNPTPVPEPEPAPETEPTPTPEA